MRIKPAVAILIILVLCVLLITLSDKNVKALSSLKQKSIPGERVAMYVPSPFELSAMESTRDLWPRAFGPKSPPAIEDLPKIYAIFQRQHQGKGDDVVFFRSLAMTSILGQWDAFQEMLSYRIIEKGSSNLTPEQLYKWVQKEKCSVYGKELAYRLVFWDTTYIPQVATFFKSCDANSFHALWFELLNLNSQKSNEAKAALKDAFQKKRESAQNESFEYFLLTQAYAALDLKLAHGK